MPITQHIDVYAGDPWTADVTVLDTDTEQPTSVVGADWLAQVRYPTGQLATSITVTPVDPINGQIRLSLTGAQTAALTRNGRWDLQITPADGPRQTLFAGDVRRTPDRSR